MSGLVSFLLFAAFFFLMMRFGCGAHASHGGHHSNHGNDSGDITANGTDPVCGMHVDAGAGFAKMYRGAKYRFCSRACVEMFDAAPDKYMGKLPQAAGHGGHSS